MVLDHVAYGAGFFVVSASPLNTERLRDSNLYMINMRVIPHRLQQDVGETQRHEVLHRLLAQIMIDAKDVSLEEDRTDHIVNGRSARAVSADWLLDDDA